MKRIICLVLLGIFIASTAYASINWVNGYSRKDNTWVSGHFKDTSSDGIKWNNASYLGYNY